MAEKEGSGVFRLGEILAQNHWVQWADLENALKIQKETGQMIGTILVEKGFVTTKNLYRALAQQYNMTFVDFESIKIQPAAVKLIKKETVYEHRVMPLVYNKGELLVAISNPLDAWAESSLHSEAGDCEVRMVLATPEDINVALHQHYGPEN